MRSNRLRLNPTKTEFLWCATARRRHQVNLEPIHIDSVDIASSANVRNLGVMMNGDFSMTTHVKKLVRSCFHSLRQISSHSPITYKRGRQNARLQFHLLSDWLLQRSLCWPTKVYYQPSRLSSTYCSSYDIWPLQTRSYNLCTKR